MLKRLVLVSVMVLITGFALECFGKDRVTLRLNWYTSGNHAPIYLAFERGYFSNNGIDLVINQGQGSGVAVKLVANKDDMFALADVGVTMSAIDKGMPIRIISPMNQKTDIQIITLSDSGIKTPRILKAVNLEPLLAERQR